MSKNNIFKILVCAILFAAAVREVQAQNNAPAQGGPARGGFGGGGGRFPARRHPCQRKSPCHARLPTKSPK